MDLRSPLTTHCSNFLPRSHPVFEWGSSRWDPHVDSVIDSWIGTPYGLNQSKKQVAVDCIRFVTSCCDELLQRPQTDYTELPPDTAMHRPDLAARAMRQIMKLFRPYRVWKGGPMKPGSILVEYANRGGPQHAKILTTTPMVVAHATSEGVVRAPLLVTGSKFRLYEILPC